MEPSRNNSETLYKSFELTYHLWNKWLSELDFSTLVLVPSSGGWSIGQLYLHLINETNWYLDQVIECLGNSANHSEQMTESAKVMFANNSFPDIKIKGDTAINDSIPQPESKEALLDSFLLMMQKAQEVWTTFLHCDKHGKSQHPGLGYFSPEEWMQYADMHFRHHRKQKDHILAMIHND
ncbi:MAG: hypothetical protein CMB80_17300 [Flammeovirgaceae bacterium]|nr:hypothetical protein [Flammeovirgaceae bacterium]HCX20690.1 hypothetical protein [Cytophagales bacterium]|tara:strand:+ start:4907 stop:5446 length:540 start_codon:yes stop_codon:yes gene_type:complete